MTREEYIQQLDSLIEHFNNGGLDFNATDILAIKKLLEQNQKYKEVIDKAIDKLYCYGEVLNPDFQKEMLDILKEVE